MATLSALLDRLDGRRVYLDTNCFIYFLQSSEQYAPLVSPFLERSARGLLEIVTSELTIAEMLVKPYKEARPDIAQQYRRFFSMERIIATRPIGLGILDAAAALRATHRLSLADAIHLATAIDGGCAIFLTNDSGIRGPGAVEIVQLSDLSEKTT